MSEPKLLKNTCPQCGGKLRVKKGIFFTFASCVQCKTRLAWLEGRAPQHQTPAYGIEEWFKADLPGYLSSCCVTNPKDAAAFWRELNRRTAQIDKFLARIKAGEKVDCKPYHGQEAAMRELRGDI